MIPTGVLTVTCGSKLGELDLGDGWLPSSETGGCRLCQVVGNWSSISETGGFRLRRQVVAVPAKWLEVGQASRRRVVAVSAKCLGVGQVSRRRVVAVFGDGWLPSPPSGWELVWYLGDGWLPSSETGGCRPSSRNEKWGKLPGSPARLCARFLALVSWCPVCVGGLGLWPSVPVLCVGLVPSCAPGLVALSGFVRRVCFKKR